MRQAKSPKFYTFSNSPNIDWSCLAFDIYNIKAWSIEKVFPLKLIVKRWNSNGVYHQRFRPKNEIEEIDHLNVVIKWKYHLLLLHSFPFSDSSGYTTMFQIDDLDAEIKRSDHLSVMEIKKIMHTHIDTMGPCIFFITISALDYNIWISCWIK